MLSYRPLRISVSLQDKHDYSPSLCHSNRTSLPAPPSRPLAIYPDKCNQLEQQILAGGKKRNLSSFATSLYCLLYATFIWTRAARIQCRRKRSIFQHYFFIFCTLFCCLAKLMTSLFWSMAFFSLLSNTKIWYFWTKNILDTIRCMPESNSSLPPYKIQHKKLCCSCNYCFRTVKSDGVDNTSANWQYFTSGFTVYCTRI